MNIKKLNIKTLVWAIVPALLIGFSACGDDDTPPPSTTTPAKTLNKTTLTNNKKWQNVQTGGPTITHYFKNDGIYGSANLGKWRWVNNSDTMEIDNSGSNNYVKWKINWNNDTEMECEWIGNGPARLFKLVP
jgi:hypothetical protein